MGYIKHEAVIAVLFDEKLPEHAELEALRQEMNAADSLGYEGTFGQYLLGPVYGVNGYTTWVLVPDGSKEGWDYSDKMDAFRERFLAIVRKSRYPNIVHLKLGGDDKETAVYFTTDNEVLAIPRAVTPEESK